MPRKWYQPLSQGEALQPIPWLAPDVIQYLDNLIQPDWEIIEHGSGGSTLWFAERAKSVTAYEDKPDWQKIVAEQAPENVTITDMKAFILSRSNCDLLLIDGEPIEHRANWIRQASELVKPGGWVVLDNANHKMFNEAKQELLKSADLITTFDNNEGGTQYLVTEFYKIRPLAVDIPFDYGATMAEQPKKKRRKKAGNA